MASIHLTWTDQSGSGLGLPTDIVHGFVHNAQLAVDVPIPPTVARSVGSQILTLPTGHLSTHDYHCYIAFRRADGLDVSGTQYLLVT